MFDKHYILDENGEIKTVGLMEWAMWFENGENRIVKFTKLPDCEVSTVFLGLDHNWTPRPDPNARRKIDDDWESSLGNFDEQPPDWSPIMFETMIFGGKYNEYQWRYRTYERAKLHHLEVVEILRAGGDPTTEEFIL